MVLRRLRPSPGNDGRPDRFQVIEITNEDLNPPLWGP